MGMSNAAKLFSATMAKSREQGDITLKCEGKVIKAHSFILKGRSDYFKTAEDFKAVVGDRASVFEVKDCPHNVLEAVIDFMYGIDLPGTFNTPDMESLLLMADLYLMDDLKDDVASHMATRLNKDNILDIYHLAEKYTALRLKEVCSNFIVTNVDIANKVLGVDAATILKRSNGDDNPYKKNMIVCCKRRGIGGLILPLESQDYTRVEATVAFGLELIVELLGALSMVLNLEIWR